MVASLCFCRRSYWSERIAKHGEAARQLLRDFCAVQGCPVSILDKAFPNGPHIDFEVLEDWVNNLAEDQPDARVATSEDFFGNNGQVINEEDPAEAVHHGVETQGTGPKVPGKSGRRSRRAKKATGPAMAATTQDAQPAAEVEPELAAPVVGKKAAAKSGRKKKAGTTASVAAAPSPAQAHSIQPAVEEHENSLDIATTSAAEGPATEAAARKRGRSRGRSRGRGRGRRAAKAAPAASPVADTQGAVAPKGNTHGSSAAVADVQPAVAPQGNAHGFTAPVTDAALIVAQSAHGTAATAETSHEKVAATVKSSRRKAAGTKSTGARVPAAQDALVPGSVPIKGRHRRATVAAAVGSSSTQPIAAGQSPLTKFVPINKPTAASAVAGSAITTAGPSTQTIQAPVPEAVVPKANKRKAVGPATVAVNGAADNDVPTGPKVKRPRLDPVTGATIMENNAAQGAAINVFGDVTSSSTQSTSESGENTEESGEVVDYEEEVEEDEDEEENDDEGDDDEDDEDDEEEDDER